LLGFNFNNNKFRGYMQLFLKHVLTCVVIFGVQSAFAGDMYRCGNSFQDTPCVGTTKDSLAKPIKASSKKTPVALNKTAVEPSKGDASKDKAPAANSADSKVDTQTQTTQAPATIDTDCRQRGDASKKISWMREIGKTIDEQLTTAPDFKTKQLVADVYNHTGSSLQVKNAIERECMQQKEKDKLADKLMIEARRLRGGQ
jgi:hypothetical protein